MDTYDKIKAFILRLQQLPEKEKKSILVVVMAISTVILFSFAIITTKNNIASIKKQITSEDFPKLKLEMPSIDVSNMDNIDTSIKNISDEDAKVRVRTKRRIE